VGSLAGFIVGLDPKGLPSLTWHGAGGDGFQYRDFAVVVKQDFAIWFNRGRAASSSTLPAKGRVFRPPIRFAKALCALCTWWKSDEINIVLIKINESLIYWVGRTGKGVRGNGANGFALKVRRTLAR